MNRITKPAFALGMALLLALPVTLVVAQESDEESAEGSESGLPELIQEFALSETVYPQDKGETQITLSTVRLRSDEERLRVTALKVEYGITDRLQIEAEAPYLSLRPFGESRRRGIGDSSFGVSYNLRPGGGKRTAVSMGFEVGLPSGDEEKELGEGDTTFEPSFVVARQFGKGQVHLNLGAEMGGAEREYSYAVAAVYPVSRRFYPTLELNGFLTEGEASRLYLTPGAVFHIGRNAELGIGIPIGLRAHGERIGPVGKFTVEF